MVYSLEFLLTIKDILLHVFKTYLVLLPKFTASSKNIIVTFIMI